MIEPVDALVSTNQGRRVALEFLIHARVADQATRTHFEELFDMDWGFHIEPIVSNLEEVRASLDYEIDQLAESLADDEQEVVSLTAAADPDDADYIEQAKAAIQVDMRQLARVKAKLAKAVADAERRTADCRAFLVAWVNKQVRESEY